MISYTQALPEIDGESVFGWVFKVHFDTCRNEAERGQGERTQHSAPILPGTPDAEQNLWHAAATANLVKTFIP